MLQADMWKLVYRTMWLVRDSLLLLFRPWHSASARAFQRVTCCKKTLFLRASLAGALVATPHGWQNLLTPSTKRWRRRHHSAMRLRLVLLAGLAVCSLNTSSNWNGRYVARIVSPPPPCPASSSASLLRLLYLPLFSVHTCPERCSCSHRFGVSGR